MPTDDIQIRVEQLANQIQADPEAFKLMLEGVTLAMDDTITDGDDIEILRSVRTLSQQTERLVEWMA